MLKTSVRLLHSRQKIRPSDSTMFRASGRADIHAFLMLLLCFKEDFARTRRYFVRHCVMLATTTLNNSLKNLIFQNSRFFAIVPLDIALQKVCLAHKTCFALGGSVGNPVEGSLF